MYLVPSIFLSTLVHIVPNFRFYRGRLIRDANSYCKKLIYVLVRPMWKLYGPMYSCQSHKRWDGDRVYQFNVSLTIKVRFDFWFLASTPLDTSPPIWNTHLYRLLAMLSYVSNHFVSSTYFLFSELVWYWNFNGLMASGEGGNTHTPEISKTTKGMSMKFLPDVGTHMEAQNQIKNWHIWPGL